VLAQPGGHDVGGASFDQVNRVVGAHVDHDCSVHAAAPDGEVVDPEPVQAATDPGIRQCPDPPQ
jgi:hypothetical protein